MCADSRINITYSNKEMISNHVFMNLRVGKRMPTQCDNGGKSVEMHMDEPQRRGAVASGVAQGLRTLGVLAKDLG